MQPLSAAIFYTLEKAIKTYRRFAQTSITKAGVDITIDQWLVLRTLQEHPGIAQHEIAAMVFKDFASVTRITQLLATKAFIARSPSAHDGRRFDLKLTAAGRRAIRLVEPIIADNRRQALRGVSGRTVRLTGDALQAIINNCQTEDDA